MQDVPGENISEVFEEAVDWIETALKVTNYSDVMEGLEIVLQDGGKILVNCFVGSSRSATVVMAFLIRHRWG